MTDPKDSVNAPPLRAIKVTMTLNLVTILENTHQHDNLGSQRGTSWQCLQKGQSKGISKSISIQGQNASDFLVVYFPIHRSSFHFSQCKMGIHHRISYWGGHLHLLAPNIPIGGVKGQVVPICVQVHLSVKNGGFETWPLLLKDQVVQNHYLWWDKMAPQLSLIPSAWQHGQNDRVFDLVTVY